MEVGVDQNIKEDFVIITKYGTMWYNNVKDVLEECYKPSNKINLLVF